MRAGINERVITAQARIPVSVKTGSEKGKNQFRNLLLATGLNQSELARRLSVHPNTVSQWATGKKRMPGPAVAYLRLYARVKELLE